MFELVKMTHVCRYWRSTLISSPHLWSSILVKNCCTELVAACLERSQQVPLAVYLDIKYDYNQDHREYHGGQWGSGDGICRVFSGCTCFQWSPSGEADEKSPCSSRTPILSLLNNHTERIRKLCIYLSLVNESGEPADNIFRDALVVFKSFAYPLPFLESVRFSVDPEFGFGGDPYAGFSEDMFGWRTSPPTNLRHLTLHGCYGGPILSLKNLTSFKLSGPGRYDPMELNQDLFLPFISRNPSLVSLTLTHCSFPVRFALPRVTPAELPRLKTLQLSNISESLGFPRLVEIPALKTLSSLHILAQRKRYYDYGNADFRVCAQGDDGFQLSIDVPELSDSKLVEDKLVSNWLGITHTADPRPAFVRLERQAFYPQKVCELNSSPLPLLVNAKVLEINASFAGRWYRNFWDDLEKIGPQLTTLRLEVTEGMDPGVATSVKKFVRARLEKGMPLTKLERMAFGGVRDEDERKANKLWEEFRARLDIDQYLASQWP